MQNTIQTWLKSLDKDTVLISQIKPSDWERLYKELEKVTNKENKI